MTSDPVRRLAPVLAGLWAGSLLTVCGIVAPGVFAALDDRRLAGALAGRFFRIEAWLGAAIAIVLVCSLAARKVQPARRFDYVLIALTAGAPIVSELALRPIMETARLANDMTRFGALHGASAVLFAGACVGALALVWRLNRPAA